MIEFAIITAKLVAVPFGVPFSHTYHNDFRFNSYAKGTASNRPPKIFGYGDGFGLASTGSAFSFQCAKCGVQGDFTVEGSLAFSLEKGITKGTVSLVNHDPLSIDAIFGITLEGQYDKPVKDLSQELLAVPLIPIAIPGIITLGPQISLSAAADLILNGKIELLLGGSLSVAPGTSVLSITDKSENKLVGLESKFTPIFKVWGIFFPGPTCIN